MAARPGPSGPIAPILRTSEPLCKPPLSREPSPCFWSAAWASGADTLNITASDGTLSSSGSVALTVKSAAQQAADLRAQVNALQAAGVLKKTQANILLGELDLKGNSGDIGKVQSFLNDVAGYLKSGVLTQAQADSLLGPGNILLTSVTRR
jgi:hypothetical protein